MLTRLFANEIRAWNGKARLSTLFWRSGVLTSSVLALIYAGTIYSRRVVAEQILLVVVALYSVWILVSIWRCSMASDSAFAVLARFVTIAWAANVALVLVFRQFDLLSFYLDLPEPAAR